MNTEYIEKVSILILSTPFDLEECTALKLLMLLMGSEHTGYRMTQEFNQDPYYLSFLDKIEQILYLFPVSL